ncbi:small integral membrane protein 45 isoform X1 [Prinia subflava]|uniref:small integral membrane protein 45 isoform X1 n=1 Tax=Prinia subflava TaxID=208062 RepID=UPI002FDFC5F9
MQSVADSRYCVCGGRPAVGSPGEAAAGLTLPGRRRRKPPGVPVGSEVTLLAACPSAVAAPAIPPTLPASRPSAPVVSRCRPALPAQGLPGTAWPGKEPDSSRLGPGRCRREQSHLVALHPWKKYSQPKSAHLPDKSKLLLQASPAEAGGGVLTAHPVLGLAMMRTLR